MAENDMVYECVLKGNFKEVGGYVQEKIDAGIDPQSIIDNSLIKAMEEIGRRFEAGQAFVPEMLLAARAMKTALDLLKPHMKSGEITTIGTVVIGTVKGDLHDIGKNLVASMLEGRGFKVVNLGTDVSGEKFIKAVREQNADIICMSALLTTTMVQMEQIIKEVEAAGLRDKVRIMVGGAPVNEDFAMKIGADGYSDNANAATELAKRLMVA